jgi:8-oxo-dGTP pyrophosphatase MutT (NUDIX family)
MYIVFINNRPVYLVNDSYREAFKRNTIWMRYHEGLMRLLLQITHFENHFFSEAYIVGDPELMMQEIRDTAKEIHAAGGLVRNESGELLMILRNGKWDLPKGKIDKGESIEQAAVREVQEECGLLQIQLLQPAGTTYHTYADKEQLFLKTTHWFTMSASNSEKLVPQTTEGIEQVKWMNESQVNAALENSFASVVSLLSR